MQNQFKINTSTINSGDNNFSERLSQLSDAPKKLYTKGQDLDKLLSAPTVGIVGSRKVSTYGRRVTQNFAYELSKSGVVVVSGLALGVDSIAHRATLDAKGSTIAVLPCGIESIYPASHVGLAEQILDRGTLISEYPASERPMKHYFIGRNRIIAALSDILIITEAAEKSGSLHTANFALDLGKPVFAIPGNIDSPTSAGTNQLIRSGAIPALSPKDVLEELGIKDTDRTAYIPENEHEKEILTAIGKGVHETNLLANNSNLPLNILQQQLTLLEIKGVIRAEAGRWYII